MKKSFLVFLSLILVMVFSSSNANAYNLIGGRWLVAAQLTWYYDNYISTQTKTAATSAATAWNNADIAWASLKNSTGGKVYITETSDKTTDSDGWAQIKPCGACHNYTSATITVNTAKTMTYGNPDALKSVLVHEFGHVFGLDHNDKARCIMISYTYGSGSRYGEWGLTIPQTDDIDGVKSIYN